MKSALLSLACLLGLAACPITASAQTTTLYGRPGTYHPNGDISCADNDRLCATISGPVKAGIVDTPMEISSSSSSSSKTDATTTTEVTVFTENGPILFNAASTYQVTSDASGRKTYHFKKIGPSRRVVYTN